jgi:hypothetical protein
MSRPTVDEDKVKFLDRLKEFNGYAGNTRLRKKLSWEEDRYWRTHAILIDEATIARGRGKGGSVNLINDLGGSSGPDSVKEVVSHPEAKPRRELDLYEPAKLTIESGWARERGYDERVVEVTGLPGRRATGGTWTRPDLAVLAVKAYPYLPGRYFEIITFEVKTQDAIDVTGVFEALSHLQFASLSYVVFFTNGKDFEKDFPDIDRILTLAKTHGVGVIVAASMENYEDRNELLEPRRNVPDPEQANLFIGTCFSEDTKARVVKWHK